MSLEQSLCRSMQIKKITKNCTLSIHNFDQEKIPLSAFIKTLNGLTIRGSPMVQKQENGESHKMTFSYIYKN